MAAVGQYNIKLHSPTTHPPLVLLCTCKYLSTPQNLIHLRQRLLQEHHLPSCPVDNNVFLAIPPSFKDSSTRPSRPEPQILKNLNLHEHPRVLLTKGLLIVYPVKSTSSDLPIVTPGLYLR
jgi:hypothetical protein